MAESKWNGFTRILVRCGAIAAAAVAVFMFSSQLGLGTLIGPALGLDARYALAADVKEIQADVLALRRDMINREYLEFQRAAERRQLSHLERERVETLQRLLRQLDQRLRKIGRPPGE